MSFSSDRVAIFWDYENCNRSLKLNGYEVAKRVHATATTFGNVVLFHAYLEVAGTTPIHSRVAEFHSQLQLAGVLLVHCQHSGKKDVSDKMILVDMMVYALETQPPLTIFLISGDRDFSYAVSTLVQRGYRVVTVSLPGSTHSSMKELATIHLDWDADIIMRGASHLPSPSSAGGRTPLYARTFDSAANRSQGTPTYMESSIASVPSPKRPLPRAHPETDLNFSTFPPTEFDHSLSEGTPRLATMHANTALDQEGTNSVSKDSPKLAKYRNLLMILNDYRDLGCPRINRSDVKAILLEYEEERAYIRSGVTGFDTFTAMAVRDEVITVGGEGDDAWVAVHPHLISNPEPSEPLPSSDTISLRELEGRSRRNVDDAPNVTSTDHKPAVVHEKRHILRTGTRSMTSRAFSRLLSLWPSYAV